MLKNLSEGFVYSLLPEAIVSLDERGLIQAICGGFQDRLGDLRALGRNVNNFFDTTGAIPQTGNNAVLVDLQSDQGAVYTRSLDFMPDTPPDGTAALTTWAAAQLGLETSDLLSVRYGVDLLRLVDANVLGYLASTVGAVLYQSTLIADADVAASQQRLLNTYFPRLKVKGTVISFEALGKALGFDDVVMIPLWSRVSPRAPENVGAPENDPDFAATPDFCPQQVSGPFYDPLATRDGPFYTWVGTVSNGTASTEFYTSVVNGFSPFITVTLLGSLAGTKVPSIQNGVVVHPVTGSYALGGGEPYGRAYVDPPGSSIRFNAIVQGSAYNGLLVQVTTTGTLAVLTITDRLSSLKYRSSYFDIGLTADMDKVEEIYGASAVKANKDLAGGTNTPDGPAVSPFLPWVQGSIAGSLVVEDWLTRVDSSGSHLVVARHEAAATDRQLNYDALTGAGVQVTQAMEEVRPATRLPRKIGVGFLLKDTVPYALSGTETPLFVTGVPTVYSGSSSSTPIGLFTADIWVQTGTVYTEIPAAADPTHGTLWHYLLASTLSGSYDFSSGSYRFDTTGMAPGSTVWAFYAINPSDTEHIRPEPSFTVKFNGAYQAMLRPEDELGDELVDEVVDDYPWRRDIVMAGEVVEVAAYAPTAADVGVDPVSQDVVFSDQSGAEVNVYAVKASGTNPMRLTFQNRAMDSTYQPGLVGVAYSGTFRNLSSLTAEDTALVNSLTDFDTVMEPGYKVYHAGIVQNVLVADLPKFFGPHHRDDLVGWLPFNEHVEDDVSVADHAWHATQELLGVVPTDRVWSDERGWTLRVQPGALLTSATYRQIVEASTLSFWLNLEAGTGGTTTIVELGPLSFVLNEATGVLTGYVDTAAGGTLSLGTWLCSGWTFVYIRKSATEASFGAGSLAASVVDMNAVAALAEGTPEDRLNVRAGNRAFAIHDLRIWNAQKTQAQMDLVRYHAPTVTAVNYPIGYVYTANRQDRLGLRVLPNGWITTDTLPAWVRKPQLALVRRYDNMGSYSGESRFKEVGLGGGRLPPDAGYVLGNVYSTIPATGTQVVGAPNRMPPAPFAVAELSLNGLLTTIRFNQPCDVSSLIDSANYLWESQPFTPVNVTQLDDYAVLIEWDDALEAGNILVSYVNNVPLTEQVNATIPVRNNTTYHGNALAQMPGVNPVWFASTLSGTYAFSGSTPLSNYVLDLSVVLPVIATDASGVAYSPVTDTLFVIRNSNSDIYEFSTSGAHLRTITTDLDDAEGICWMSGSYFAVVEEKVADIVIWPITPVTVALLKASGTVINPGLGTFPGNDGLEGISYDPINDVFYIGRERQTSVPTRGGMRVYRVERSGANTQPFYAPTALPEGFTDLAEVFYDAYTNRLYLLSQEAKSIVDIDLDGRVQQVVSYPVGMSAPEGMTFNTDRSIMWLVGEPNEMRRYRKTTLARAGTNTPWPGGMEETNPCREAIWVVGDDSYVWEITLDGTYTDVDLRVQRLFRVRTDSELSVSPLVNALLTTGTYVEITDTGSITASGSNPATVTIYDNGTTTLTSYDVTRLNWAEQPTGAQVMLSENGTVLTVGTDSVPYQTISGTQTTVPAYLYLHSHIVAFGVAGTGTDSAYSKWTDRGNTADDQHVDVSPLPTIESSGALVVPARGNVGEITFLNNGVLSAGRYRLRVESGNIGRVDADFTGFRVEITVNSTVLDERLLKNQTGFNLRGFDEFEFDIADSVMGDWFLTFLWSNPTSSTTTGTQRQLVVYSYILRKLETQLYKLSIAATGTTPDLTLMATGSPYSVAVPGGWLLAMNSYGTLHHSAHEAVVYSSNDTIENRQPLANVLTSTTPERREDILLPTNEVYASDVPLVVSIGSVGTLTDPAYNEPEWLMSGGITVNPSAVITAKLRADAGQVRVAVSTDLSFSGAIYSDFQASSLEANNRTLKWRVPGLEAGSRYYYAIESDGSLYTTSTGTFRTWGTGALDFNFAVASCENNFTTGAAHNPLWDVCRANDLLFFLNCGDFHYWDITQDSKPLFRAAYASVFSEPYHRQAFMEIPFVYMYDDHDFAGNDQAGAVPSRSACQGVYREIVPHYQLPAGAGAQPSYFSFRVGRCQIIVTDLRSARTGLPSQNADSPDKSMLGAVQKAWFKQQVLQANADPYLGAIFWISSVPWTGAFVDGGDKWLSYAYERRELCDFFASIGLTRFFIIHGDEHSTSIDDGRYSDWQSGVVGTAGTGHGYPVFGVAPFRQVASVSAGPRFLGPSPHVGGGVYAHYGHVAVRDDGTNCNVGFTALGFNGTTVLETNGAFRPITWSFNAGTESPRGSVYGWVDVEGNVFTDSEGNPFAGF